MTAELRTLLKAREVEHDRLKSRGHCAVGVLPRGRRGAWRRQEAATRCEF
jgi:hypothetical protein